jgi:DNA-binding MarR family transcriptional regulator
MDIANPVPTTGVSADAVTLRVSIARIYRYLRLRAGSDITPSQSSVLFRIESSEPVRMGVLAQLERITPATLSKVVDSLVNLGLIERYPDPLDGRVTLLRLSADGRSMVTAQRIASTQLLESALKKLTPAQQRSLGRALPALESLSEALLGQDELD